MHTFDFLDEIVILCLAAVVVIIAFNRFKLPPIIGLLSAGLFVGPSGLGLVAQDEIITAISELGIILLLFTIGLEFSLNELRRLRTIVLVGGPLQVGFASVVAGTLAYFISMFTNNPLSLNASLLIGMATALSSTAICTKILKDRRELSLPHGRAVMGILIFQDIAVVPLMIIVTIMVPGTGIDVIDGVFRLGVLVFVTTALIVGLRVVLPRLVPYVIRVSTPEVLILGGLALCLGSAWITGVAGMSMALGAFIAGVAIAGSEEGHAFARVLQPMRDAFTSIFFLSIGLLVHVSWLNMPFTMIAALGALLINALVVTVILLSLRINIRTAVLAGVILAQVGEFSFVLAKAGQQYGIITTDVFQIMIITIIITMIVTPTLITFAPLFAEHAAPIVKSIQPIRWWYSGGQQDEASSQISSAVSDLTDGPMVTIVGAGVLGTNVARVFARTGISYRILELNSAVVANLQSKGEYVLHGDIIDSDALERAGVKTASVIIIAISDQTVLAQGVRSVRRLRPDVLIIVRARYATDTELLAGSGADIVVTEEYESSIQVFVTVLEHLGLDPEVIRQQEKAMREDRYGLLARLRKADNSSP